MPDTAGLSTWKSICSFSLPLSPEVGDGGGVAAVALCLSQMLSKIPGQRETFQKGLLKATLIQQTQHRLQETFGRTHLECFERDRNTP